MVIVAAPWQGASSGIGVEAGKKGDPMPSLGHIAFGLAATPHACLPRANAKPPTTKQIWVTAIILASVSYAPDLDVIGFMVGIPYEHIWGHRGATHSIGWSLLVGGVGTAIIRLSGRSWGLLAGLSIWRLFLLLAGLTLSHALLDMMTTGGLGVALFWPVDHGRYFLPWQFIPVAKIGLAIDAYQLKVFAKELLIFAPCLLYAYTQLRSRRHVGGQPRQNKA